MMVRDLHRSFTNGLAFCAILSSLFPDDIDMGAVNSMQDEERLLLAWTVAGKLQIPPLLDGVGLKDAADERSIIVYLLSLSEAMCREEAVRGYRSDGSPARLSLSDDGKTAPRIINDPAALHSRFQNGSLERISTASSASSSFIFRVYISGMQDYRSFVGTEATVAKDLSAMVTNRIGWEAETFALFFRKDDLGMCGDRHEPCIYLPLT